ncbi:YceD family protein [Mesorhizobium koreense]|uniref:YceD family protein n=1 Tax=Mesorhizobium koreense TaxID=3074855 RepID=UPI00287BB8DC|nr:DUF177 domain-containing protein [Mesorhizobium sp. WR6]
MNGAAKSPVSFRASVVRLPKKGMPVTIDASLEQRAALAREHGLLDVKKFHANLVVSPWKSDGVSVSGHVEGDIVQECVVTLEPIDAHIEAEVSAVFIPEGSNLGGFDQFSASEVILDPDGPDAPESFSGTHIDVGALAEQFFALGIDPYPRKEGIEPFATADVEEENQPLGTLAEKLAALKRRL